MKYLSMAIPEIINPGVNPIKALDRIFVLLYRIPKHDAIHKANQVHHNIRIVPSEMGSLLSANLVIIVNVTEPSIEIERAVEKP